MEEDPGVKTLLLNGTEKHFKSCPKGPLELRKAACAGEAHVECLECGVEDTAPSLAITNDGAKTCSDTEGKDNLSEDKSNHKTACLGDTAHNLTCTR